MADMHPLKEALFEVLIATTELVETVWVRGKALVEKLAVLIIRIVIPILFVPITIATKYWIFIKWLGALGIGIVLCKILYFSFVAE